MANELDYRDRLCNVSCSMCGSEPAEILKLTRALNVIVKDLGETSLSDPCLWQMLRGRNFSDRMIESAVRHVQDGIRMKCISRANELKEKEKERARREREEQERLFRERMQHDTESRKTLMWRNGILYEIDREPSPEVRRQVEQIEKIVGTYDRETAEKALREMNALEEMKPNGESVIEQLAGMGVTLTSPDESVNLLAERLENENPKKDEGRWRKKRIVKEAGHFENLRNTKYGQDGKKGSLWSRIKSAICGR